LEVKTSKISGSQIEIAVEIPRKIWDDYLEDYYQKSRRNIKIDGFRPGKVPMGLVRKIYGPGIAMAAADDFVKENYTKALDNENIDPIVPGSITEVDYTEDRPFTFKAVVEVMPQLEITGLDQMRTFLDEVEIQDDDVETGINSLREEQAIAVPTEDPIGERCLVTADAQGVNRTGVPLISHNMKDITVEIGRNVFGPELDLQLTGKKAGDQVLVSFKAGSQESELQDVYYRFDIKDVKRKELPEIDEDFAKTVNPEFDSIEKLRLGIKDFLHRQANSRAKVQMVNRLVEYLLENNRIDVPPSMLKNYLEKLLENAKKENGSIDTEDFNKKYEPSAVRNLK